jgi:hypothetical protein
VKYVYYKKEQSLIANDVQLMSPAAVADEAAVGVHPLQAVAHHSLVQKQGWTYWNWTWSQQ